VNGHGNGSASASRGNARKGKKPQRPGNPSGVPWTRHWDSNVSHDSDGREIAGLTYGDDDPPPSSGNPSGGPTSTARRAFSSGALLRGDRSFQNVQDLKMMPPPSSFFIGPVVSPSGAGSPAGPSTEHSGSSRKKTKEKNGRGKDFKKGEAVPVSFVQEEEWDDSALIDAWNAAEEEYRVSNIWCLRVVS